MVGSNGAHQKVWIQKSPQTIRRSFADLARECMEAGSSNLVHVVDSHFAQWYCDVVEGITAHPSLIDFPARTELHHLR